MNSQASDKVFAGLRRFNIVMGFLHLVQGILKIALSNDTTYPIFTNFLKFDRATFSLVPDPQLAYNLRFGPAVAVFLLISAVAHFYLSTVGYKKYVANLKHGMNPIEGEFRQTIVDYLATHYGPRQRGPRGGNPFLN